MPYYRNIDDAIVAVRTYLPTGNESDDVHALYALIDQLGNLKGIPEVRRELITIFERNPEADLGSPGPIVHSLEKSSIDEHVDLLAESLRRKATVMTIWMAERCFRSKLSERNRTALIEALKSARGKPNTREVAASIEDALVEYGK